MTDRAFGLADRARSETRLLARRTVRRARDALFGKHDLFAARARPGRVPGADRVGVVSGVTAETTSAAASIGRAGPFARSFSARRAAMVTIQFEGRRAGSLASWRRHDRGPGGQRHRMGGGHLG